MLEVSQTFLGNKTGRKFLLIYLLIMHFLVFTTLYRLSPCRHHDTSLLTAAVSALPAVACLCCLVRCE